MKRSRLMMMLAALALCVGLCFVLGACGDGECKHSYSETVTVEVGCENDGLLTYLCADCGDSYTETVTALGHDIDTHEAKAATCLESGWQAYETCKRCDYTSEYVEIPKKIFHSVANGACTVCHLPESTPGLSFGRRSDGSYELDYLDGCTASDIVVGIYMGKSVTSIYSGVFQFQSQIKSVTIGDSVTSIGKYAFDSCTGLERVTIGDGVTVIPDSAFGDCSSLTSVTLGDNVTKIEKCAFMSCSRLTSVTIGVGVTSIERYAFMYCIDLKTIKYRGTEEQWNAIAKEEHWDNATGKYTVIFNYTGE